MPGRDVCRWHSSDPDDVAKHREESRRGGENRRREPFTLDLLATVLDVDVLNLETAAGTRKLLAETIRHLARRPFSTATANSMSQCVLAQRSVIETSDLEERLTVLEASNGAGRRRVA